MNRRDFMKSAPVATVGLATISPELLGQASILEQVFDPLMAKPKTVDELRVAIESLFEMKGTTNRATVYHQGVMLPVKTYTANCEKMEGWGDTIDAYYPDPIQPVQAMWEQVKRYKRDIRADWTEEMRQDRSDESEAIAGTIMWWRQTPELIETENKLYTVRMRAKFA